MKTLVFAGLAAALATLPAPAQAAGESAGSMPAQGMGTAHGPRPNWGTMPGSHRPIMHRWGARPNGRWWAGWRAPGGWNAYRRPSIGWYVPNFWIAPTYYVSNWGYYGFPQPASGLAWSRYYDDAVLIDGNGRVYDSRSGIDWNYGGYGYEDSAVPAYPDGYGNSGYGYDDGYHDDRYAGPRRKRGKGLAGAVVGGLAGGVVGNRVAGRGDRTAGTLIGAGVGALAGVAIDKATSKRRYGKDFRPYPIPRDFDYGYADDRVTAGGWKPGTPEPAWPVAGPPHMVHGGGPRTIVTGVPMHHGYVANGFYYPPPVVTTVVIQPAVSTTTTTTTTTTYVEEVAAPRKLWRAKPAVRAKKVWRPRPKPRCTCR